MNSLPISPEEFRAAVRRVINSPEFRAAERLKSFLQFVVEETLAGRAESIKEYSVGIEVFKKPPDYDPRTDSTVRVEATKVRNRLKQYYAGSGASDIVLISIPKGGYQPQLELRIQPETLSPPGQPPPRPRFRALRWFAFPAVSLFAGALVFLEWRSTLTKRQPEPSRTYVTSFPGLESYPSLSPDGTLVAFAGDVVEPNNTDIYVKRVNGDNMLRLTSHPGVDTVPAWSPDGKYIAFIRDPGPGGSVVLTTPNADGERKLIKVSMASLAWTADGRHLAVLHRDSNIAPPRFLLVNVDSGHAVPLTDPPKPAADYRVAYSQESKSIAVARCSSSTACDIYTAPVNKDGLIEGELRRLTHELKGIQGLAWAGDSRRIIVSLGTGIPTSNDRSLFLVDAGEGSDGRLSPISQIRNSATNPTVPFLSSPSRRLLAFEESLIDTNIWRVTLPSTQSPRLPSLDKGVLIINSSQGDHLPSFSMDGKAIAFSSDRSGTFEVWVSDADGNNPRQVTSFNDSIVLFPQWSPDSTRLAFVRILREGDRHRRAIFTIRRDGKELKFITHSHDHVFEPSWSRDGQWIYHTSLRSGQYQIWKTKADGSGETIQITKQGGYRSRQSWDGSVLYYTIVGVGVWTIPANGGREEKLLPNVGSVHWTVVQDGILFLEPDAAAHGNYLVFRRDDRTGKVESLARLPYDPKTFSIDFAARFLVYSRTDTYISDIVMLENYRPF